MLPACLILAVIAASAARSSSVEIASADGANSDSANNGKTSEVTVNGRLTPPAEEQPSLEPTSALETQAAAVPLENRRLAGLDSAGNILGWFDSRSTASAIPMFSVDGVDPSTQHPPRLVGIYVPGLGLISRDAYEDPAFDSESAAKEKWGSEYEGRRSAVNSPPQPDR